MIGKHETTLPPQHQERQPGREWQMTPEPDYMPRYAGQGKLQVYPESETKFFLKVVDAQLTFARDGQGRPSGRTTGGPDDARWRGRHAPGR